MRALSGRYLDLVRDGVPELSPARPEEWDRQVYFALVRVAMSARQAGWIFADWFNLLDKSASQLGLQARRAAGRKERGRVSHSRLLAKAWDEAGRRIAKRPARTPREIAEHLALIRLYAAEANELTDSERDVLGAAVALGEKHGTLRPALPWRALAEISGRSERSTKYALKKLQDKGVLTLARRGTAAASGGRANLYDLPSLARLSVTPHTSPRDKTYGTPAQKTYGTSAQKTYGTTGVRRSAGSREEQASSLAALLADPALKDEVQKRIGGLVAEVVAAVRADRGMATAPAPPVDSRSP